MQKPSKKSLMVRKARIITGSHRSRLFELGDFPHTRPTKDRVKEALFNQLDPLSAFKNVCDLFAGVGSLAFEAASRGALSIEAVEKDKDTFHLLKKNQIALDLKITLYHQDALEFLKCTSKTYDLMICDPPYQSELIQEAMTLIKTHQKLNKDGLIACLHKDPFEHNDFEIIKQKKYGLTYVSLWKEIK